jgi:hypothetical protein
MAIVEGWDGKVNLGGNTFANLNNWKINFVQELADVTPFGTSTPDRRFQPTLRSHTVEFSGHYNGSSGQLTLTGYMKKSGTPTATTMSFITTGSKGFKGTIYVESIALDSPVDNLVTFSGSGRVSGGLSTV